MAARGISLNLFGSDACTDAKKQCRNSSWFGVMNSLDSDEMGDLK